MKKIKKRVSIVHISDTHQNFPKNLPKADFLCHTGDYSFIRKHAPLEVRIKELKEFNNYLGSLSNKYSHILFCPGNHDFLFEDEPDLAKKILNNAIVLIDEKIQLQGVNFYGTPCQPPFANWAFNHDMKTRIEKYSAIPESTNVLLTHCPPEGVLDLVSSVSYSAGERVGCPRLRHEVETRIKPELHCFGHIHENNEVKKINDVNYSNASIMNDMYIPTDTYNLMELELSKNLTNEIT